MSNNNSGLGLLGTLGVIFVVLKLLNLINWSWWLVLMPFYIPLLVVVCFIILSVIITWAGEGK